VIDIGLLVFFESREEGHEAVNGRGLAFLGRVVRRLYPAQRGSRREERKKVRWQFVGHRGDGRNKDKRERSDEKTASREQAVACGAMIKVQRKKGKVR
jgi:hypothetical protein